MDGATAERHGWLITRGLLRALATTVVMVAVYYLLPLDRRVDTSMIVVEIGVGVALLAGVIVWQVRAILRSRYPGVQAVQSLALITPLFLLFFASTYVVLSAADAGTFTETLSRSGAIYFTVTIFATVGFGDITAKTDTARLVVTAQMLLDLVVLGLVVQLIFGAVKRSKATNNGTRS
jgi:hypothetical protein